MPGINSRHGPGDAVIYAREVTMRYRNARKYALDEFRLDVFEGEIFGLLGPNGAGKTTAISILSTLLRPDSGKVNICGVDIVRHPRRVRHFIGLVPQEIALYPLLTVGENLRYFGRMHGLNGKELDIRVDESLDFVDLKSKSDQRINTFSGGMKRRANLAAGLINRPEVLFLDEPTVGIDIQSRNLILQRLCELKKQPVTMIYTTHYIEEAESICDRVAVVDEGRTIAVGEPHRLLKDRPDCENFGDLFMFLTGKQVRDD